MPTIEFKPENKTEIITDFPKLKLDTGEKARILCIEPSPTYAYVHTLRAPKIVSGVAERHTIKRKDGSTFTDYVKDFIGRPLCLGDLGVLADRGIDPTNCPACARASQTSEIDAPTRRFAMHIIQYGVKPNSWEPRAPFSCEVVIWGFTNQMFDKLTDIQAQWGNLRDHDLLLGPCTDRNFQKFELMVAPDALWQKHEQIQQIVVDTYRQNRANDLEVFCGRRVERRWMMDDIERIAARWRIANGEESTRADGTELADRSGMDSALDGLLTGTAVPAVASTVAPVVDASVDIETLLAAPATTSGSVTSTDTDFAALLGGGTAPDAAPAQPAEEPPAVDFEDLLNSI
jgi:hypothetical protein